MKRIISLFLAIAAVISLNTASLAANSTASQQIYTDVPQTHWANSPIESCYTKGLMQGVGNNRFAPESILTRAQVAQICYNAYRTMLTSTLTAALSDVPADAWYNAAVKWLVTSGLADTTETTGGEYFYPDIQANRAFTALTLYRLSIKLGVTLPRIDAPIDFPDIAHLTEEEQTAIHALQLAGVINGFPDGTYRPEDCLTRAQAAKLIDHFTDLPGLELPNLPYTPTPTPTPTPPKPTPTPTTTPPPVPDSKFLSKEIAPEIKAYALSLGYVRVVDYSANYSTRNEKGELIHVRGWDISTGAAGSGQCKGVNMTIYDGNPFWQYTVWVEGALVYEAGCLYNINEMKALLVKYADYYK